jgi:hypothetical protein
MLCILERRQTPPRQNPPWQHAMHAQVGEDGIAAAHWSDNGYGLVEQRQHRRPDRARQRVESVHGAKKLMDWDGGGALSPTGRVESVRSEFEEGELEKPAPI